MPMTTHIYYYYSRLYCKNYGDPLPLTISSHPWHFVVLHRSCLDGTCMKRRFSLSLFLLGKYKVMSTSHFKLTDELLCSLMAVKSKLHLRAFIILSVAGVYSLFPLLFHVAGKHKHMKRRRTKRKERWGDWKGGGVIETPIKIIFSLVWGLLVIPGLARNLKM